MKWKIKSCKIDELKNYIKNPRLLSKTQGEHLEKSIKKYGQCQPIVINPDGLIIGGHQRVRTMQKLGYKDVSCIIPEVELNEKQIEELNIRLNKNVGNWDWDILSNVWDVEDLLDFGFSAKEFEINSDTLESENGEMNAPKKCQIIIDCSSKRELERVNSEIDDLLIKYPDVKKKVKIK